MICDGCSGVSCIKVKSLCMKILHNSNSLLTVSCMDKGYDIGNQVEWEINSKRMASGATIRDFGSCITLDWNNLNQDKNNKIICRVKKHPSKNPNWQELQGFVTGKGDKKFV